MTRPALALPRSLPLLRPQGVSHAALGVDQRRAERVELAAQVADVGLDDLRLPGVVPAPHALQQLGAGEYPAPVPQEAGEQPKLGGRQFNRHTRPAHCPA